MFSSSTLNALGKAGLGPASSKKRIALVVLVCAIVLGSGIILFVMHSQTKQEWRKNTTSVERGAVDLVVVATGTIRPVNEVKVSPKVTGLIKRLLVKQGDVVKQGDLLAEMDDSELKGQIEAARGTYQIAQDNYLKVKNGNRPQEIAIARFQERRAQDIVHQAQQNVIRLKAQVDSVTQQSIRDDTLAVRQAYLLSQGAISDQDRLNAETQANMTRLQLEAAERELAQAEGTLAQNKAELSAAGAQHELAKIGNRAEDKLAAKDTVIQAKGNLDSLLTQWGDMKIKAPFSGIVTQKYADTGAIVTPTTSAATTSATSSSIVALAGQLEMVAQVAETDIGKIELGQKVEILPNAFPDKPFHGEVTQIAPEAVVTQNVTTFEVHTNIEDDADGRLLSGMNVSARFNAGCMDNALLVPTVCIVSRRGKNGVLIALPDGTPKFKPVKVGPTSGTKTVVLHGVQEGDLVFLGLNKDQLQQNGYSGSGGPEGRGGHGGGGGAPIPRGFGR